MVSHESIPVPLIWTCAFTDRPRAEGATADGHLLDGRQASDWAVACPNLEMKGILQPSAASESTAALGASGILLPFQGSRRQ